MQNVIASKLLNVNIRIPDHTYQPTDIWVKHVVWDRIFFRFNKFYLCLLRVGFQYDKYESRSLKHDVQPLKCD